MSHLVPNLCGSEWVWLDPSIQAPITNPAELPGNLGWLLSHPHPASRGGKRKNCSQGKNTDSVDWQRTIQCDCFQPDSGVRTSFAILSPTGWRGTRLSAAVLTRRCLSQLPWAVTTLVPVYRWGFVFVSLLWPRHCLLEHLLSHTANKGQS